MNRSTDSKRITSNKVQDESSNHHDEDFDSTRNPLTQRDLLHSQLSTNTVLQLQRIIGNAAVKRLLTRKKQPPNLSKQAPSQHQKSQVIAGQNLPITHREQTQPTIQLLRKRYPFKNSARYGVEEIKTGVYKVAFRISGKKLIIKTSEGQESMKDEVYYAKLARAAGQKVPKTRFLRKSEAKYLVRNNNLQVSTNSVIMDYIEGQDLGDLSLDPDNMYNVIHGPHLNKSQYRQLGKSIAFQVFMNGWDRWSMPNDVAESRATGRHNLGNIRVATNGRIYLIDTNASFNNDVIQDRV